MSESETPSWHQCKSELEIRYQIADDILSQLSQKAKGEIDPLNPGSILLYFKAVYEAVYIARGGEA
jgi:hypothetical protein